MLDEREIGLQGQITALTDELADARQLRDRARDERDVHAHAQEALRKDQQVAAEQLTRLRSENGELKVQRDKLEAQAQQGREQLGACRTLGVGAKIWLREDRFSTIRRPIAILWAKNRRKYGPSRRICSPAIQSPTDS